MGFVISAIDVLDDESEIQFAQRAPIQSMICWVCVRDSQHGLTEASFGVEDSSEETLVPFERRSIRPCDELPDFVDARARVRCRSHSSAACRLGLRKNEVSRFDLRLPQVILGSIQRLLVAQGEAELVLSVVGSPSAVVVVGGEQAISADHAAKISEAVFGSLCQALAAKPPVPINLLLTVRCGRRVWPDSEPVMNFQPRSVRKR